jgi:6-phosphogluconate dehydrogenase (decarboxylating)
MMRGVKAASRPKDPDIYERFSSRGGADFADRVLSAMRKQFGGHDEKKK